MKTNYLFLLLIYGLFIYSTFISAAITLPTPEHIKTFKTINTKVGQSFTIDLAVNRSTEDRWMIDNLPETDSPQGEAVLKSKTYQPAQQSNDTSGVEKWKFEALKPGKTKIFFMFTNRFGDSKNKAYQINIQP